nr:EsaB/YukD family protein [Ardenticatena sp.]
MERVVVTLTSQNRSIDADIPAMIPLVDMMWTIADALDLRRRENDEWTSSRIWLEFRLEFPKQRILRPEQTLIDARVLDGARIRVIRARPPLYALYAPGHRKAFYVYEERAILGRPPRDGVPQGGGEVFIDLSDLDVERTVSRPHAIIERKEQGYFLIPRSGTTNPTRYEDDVIEEPVILKDGALFQLGDVQLLFRLI